MIRRFIYLNRGTVFGAFIGAMIGMGSAGISYMSAQAAVRVRPALADVGFFDAAFTGHGWDWLFYHHPGLMVVPSVLLTAVVAGIIGGWWRR